MIPKIIHYCWFGRNQKPDIIEKCIGSWRRFCPDWEIREWNEANFDIESVPYMKEAYEQKKWAFVSDIARLIVIHRYGGIYLDTDVEILCPNPFDKYLQYDNILVFETERAIATGLCYGGTEGSLLSERLLKPYLHMRYSDTGEQVNSLMNKPVFVAEFPELKWNAKSQLVRNSFFMGADEYAPLMKHYGTRSWCENLPDYSISKLYGLKKVLRKPGIFEFMEERRLLRKLVPLYEFLVYDFLDLGIFFYVKRLLLKWRRKR